MFNNIYFKKRLKIIKNFFQRDSVFFCCFPCCCSSFALCKFRVIIYLLIFLKVPFYNNFNYRLSKQLKKSLKYLFCLFKKTRTHTDTNFFFLRVGTGWLFLSSLFHSKIVDQKMKISIFYKFPPCFFSNLFINILYYY